MKHHFGDLLDRDGDYWNMVPNAERYQYPIDRITPGDPSIDIATITKSDQAWRDALTLPNLVELTLHQPSRQQLESLSEFSQIARLRLSHARPQQLDALAELTNLEELVLEYVSGFTELEPIQSLPKLRSVHFENLRRVKCFDALATLPSLKYLSIYGTLDWKQPIQNFGFLGSIPTLEVLHFFQIINASPYPAMKSVTTLERLKRFRLAGNLLPVAEYAFLESTLPGVEGVDWGPFRQVEYSPGDTWFEFTGKRAGRVKCNSPHAASKCRDYENQYEELKRQAEQFVSSQSNARSD